MALCIALNKLASSSHSAIPASRGHHSQRIPRPCEAALPPVFFFAMSSEVVAGAAALTSPLVSGVTSDAEDAEDAVRVAVERVFRHLFGRCDNHSVDSKRLGITPLSNSRGEPETGSLKPEEAVFGCPALGVSSFGAAAVSSAAKDPDA